VHRDALSQASDADLGRALLAGDPAAPVVAWKRFLPLVERMLRRSIGSRGENEDVAQTVFLYFFRRVHTLRNPVALRAFVIGVTLRVARGEVRRRQKYAERARCRSEPLDHEALGSAADAATQYAFKNLCRLVRRLRQRERDAFVMRFVEGRDAAEIATLLGVSEPTARRSFSRAQEHLRRWAERDLYLTDYIGDVRSGPS
jgi:RNA polymerase sigma-70 factor (ECF subfamily)